MCIRPKKTILGFQLLLVVSTYLIGYKCKMNLTLFTASVLLALCWNFCTKKMKCARRRHMAAAFCAGVKLGWPTLPSFALESSISTLPILQSFLLCIVSTFFSHFLSIVSSFNHSLLICPSNISRLLFIENGVTIWVLL